MSSTRSRNPELASRSIRVSSLRSTSRSISEQRDQRATRSADPAPSGACSRRQAFWTKDQQRDDADQHQLPKADIEHVAQRRSFLDLEIGSSSKESLDTSFPTSGEGVARRCRRHLAWRRENS